MRTESNYIRTYTGKKAWPLELQPEDVDIADIAHALSNQCRFTGHTSDFYSVAQHCVVVSQLCSLEFKLAGLLHDADEAYLVDLATPIKHGPGFEIFTKIGKRIQQIIFEKFGVPLEQAALTKPADKKAYNLEREAFMPSGNGFKFVTSLLPRDAERMYLNEFYRLQCT